jgi:Carboxypeptidase regulatory-like domain/TonB dependent receptor-like, beta-barrel
MSPTWCRASSTRIAVAICLLFLSICRSPAQNSEVFTESLVNKRAVTATLAGTVVDERNDVVPQADVLIRDVNGTVNREVRTNQDGRFVIEVLAPRSYSVSVRHKGFRSAEIKNLNLNVHDQIALIIQLQVGSIGETVNVEANPGFLRQMGVSANLDGKFAENLPSNGRTLQLLILLAPGMVQTKSTFAEQGQFSVNGQRANANYFLVDGVSANIGVAAGAGLGQSGAGALPVLSVFGSTHTLSSLEAVQEIKVDSASYAPEFGRTPGAQVSITTRSGTNQFRGSAFEYFRHHSLEANDWFANRDSLPKPGLRHHNFGGVFAGPLVTDRVFFFMSYEGLRLSAPQVASREVPSLAARQSAPAHMRSFLEAFPNPNGENTKRGLAKFTASYSEPASLDAAAFRTDYKVNESLTLFGRYTYAPSSMVQRGLASSLNTSVLTFFNTQGLTIGGTLAVSPGIQNNFRFGYSRATATRSFVLDDLGGAVLPGDSLLFPSAVSRHDSMYGFSLGNGVSFFVGRDINNLQRQVNVINNLSILNRNHNLKLGVDYRRLLPVYGQRRYSQVASFDGVGKALSGTASSVSIVTQDQMSLAFTNFSAYFQDTWRVQPRLMLTYGLRWDVNPAPSARNGRDLVTALGLDDPARLSLAPFGTPHYKTSYGNFAPRVGLAYRLFQSAGREAVLRAGAGVFYDLGHGMIANSASYFPYLRRKNLASVAYPLDALSAEARSFSLDPPFSTVRIFESDFKLPVTFQWNVTVEQSLSVSQILSASYVGTAGRRLLRSEGLINPNPNFQQVFVVRNDATSDYHALQLQFQRRLTNKLQAIAAYTWSHSIDINSNDSFTNVPSMKIEPRLDRGPSDFDIRHSLSAAVTYQLPTLNLKGFSKSLFRNWSLDTMLFAHTAGPVDILIGRDIGFGVFNFRPDRVDGVPLYIRDGSAPGGGVINRAAFVVPETHRQGNLGRNSLRGFPMSQVNLALRRQFRIHERFDLQLRAEFQNLFNHANFGNPVGDLNSGLFGQSTSMLGRSLGSGGSNGGLSPLYQLGGPRSIQMGLKLQF